MNQTEYIPGACNIGPDEIARRRSVGWFSLAVTVVLFGALELSGINQWWRIFIFFPASLSASGFIQAHFHFCSGFARAGIFNFGALGELHKVDDDASRAMDRQKGYRIILYSVSIGGIAALVAALLG